MSAPAAVPAKRARRKPSARRQLEDIEDYYLASRRLARGGKRVTLETLEQQLRERARRSKR